METITIEIGKDIVADVVRVEDAIATKFDWVELVEGTVIKKKVGTFFYIWLFSIPL